MTKRKIRFRRPSEIVVSDPDRTVSGVKPRRPGVGPALWTRKPVSDLPGFQASDARRADAEKHGRSDATARTNEPPFWTGGFESPLPGLSVRLHRAGYLGAAIPLPEAPKRRPRTSSVPPCRSTRAVRTARPGSSMPPVVRAAGAGFVDTRTTVVVRRRPFRFRFVPRARRTRLGVACWHLASTHCARRAKGSQFVLEY